MTIHWIRPQAFWLLLVLIPLVWGLWRQLVGAKQQWQGVCDANLLPYLNVKQPARQRWPLLVLSMAWIIATIALAGPAWHKRPAPVFRSTQPTVVLFDLSPNMLASDLKPSRLQRAKFKLIDLLRQSHEGQIGLIAFSSEPFVVSPLTQDSRTIASMVPTLEPSLLPVGGHDVVLALKEARELFKQAGVVHGNIVLITDRVDKPEAYNLAKKYHAEGIDVSVLGIGTENGAPIPKPDGGFVKDNSGAMIIPKLDVTSLKKLVNTGGGIYLNLTPDNKDIEKLVQLTHTRRWSDEFQQSQIEAQLWRDEGWWIVLLLLPLVLVMFRRGYI